jgi:hypothetical protein
VLAKVMVGAHGILMRLGQGWPLGLEVLAQGLRAADEERCSDQVGLKMTGSGGGGFVFFVAPRGNSFLENFRSRLKELATSWRRRDMGIVWESAKGGFESEGLRVENNGETEFYSRRFGSIACAPTRVLHWNRGKCREVLCYQMDLELAEKCQDGIYCNFDSISSKVVLRSTPIRSEMHKAGIGLAAAIIEALATSGRPLAVDELAKAAEERTGTDHSLEMVRFCCKKFTELCAKRGLDLRLVIDKSRDEISLDATSASDLYVVVNSRVAKAA